jgi:signal transduction histidine kinase
LSFNQGMKTVNGKVDLEKLIPQTSRAHGFGIAVAFGVLAATVFSGLLFVRGLVREQIAQRDAEGLHATILMEQLDDAEINRNEVRTDEQIGFDAAVRASRLKGVIGIRFYNTKGVFTDSFPATIQPQPLDHELSQAVSRLKPASRFNPATPLSDVFIYLPQFARGKITSVPTLEVTVPLHRRDTKTLAGAVQFIIEGKSIADEYARLDRRLIQTAVSTLIVASTLLIMILWPAFWRVGKLTRNLALHIERLQRANEELAIAARVSAVGAVSAHLMHGLKNPLASLAQFVARRSGDDALDDGDWHDALTASRRMQSIINQTLEVLSDARGEPIYAVAVQELAADLRTRVITATMRREVMLTTKVEAKCALSSRTANLISLILVNLLENAIEATPPDGKVSLAITSQGEQVYFRVRDEGAGFPEDFRDRLFLPCKSTREGGCGIGLAISKQIANYLGARLELEESSPQGSVLLLALPAAACQEASQ